MIPIALQQFPAITQRNAALAGMRSEFAEAVSKIQSGAFEVKRAMADLYAEMTGEIEVLRKLIEAAVVPADAAADFEAGVYALSDFADFDTMAYYNGLKKLEFTIHGVRVALLSLQDKKTAPVSRKNMSDGVLVSLDSDEFENQGFENPVTENVVEYQYYVVLQGDTLQSIAQKTMGDANLWTEISSINDLRFDDFLDGSAVGQIIKIPVVESIILQRGNRNLVYEAVFDGLDKKKLEIFYHGRDCLVEDGRFAISPNGDIRLIRGVDNTVAAVSRRLDMVKGGLNPLHPEYGVAKMAETNDRPYIVALDRFISDLEGQAGADPRVTSAEIQRKKIKVDGDAVFCKIDISLPAGASAEIVKQVV